MSRPDLGFKAARPPQATGGKPLSSSPSPNNSLRSGADILLGAPDGPSGLQGPGSPRMGSPNASSLMNSGPTTPGLGFRQVRGAQNLIFSLTTHFKFASARISVNMLPFLCYKNFFAQLRARGSVFDPHRLLTRRTCDSRPAPRLQLAWRTCDGPFRICCFLAFFLWMSSISCLLELVKAKFV